MRFIRFATFPLLSDLKFSKIAIFANALAALVVLVLGYRYIARIAATPFEQFTGALLLLLLCIALAGLGIVVHLYELIKHSRNARSAGDHRG